MNIRQPKTATVTRWYIDTDGELKHEWDYDTFRAGWRAMVEVAREWRTNSGRVVRDVVYKPDAGEIVMVLDPDHPATHTEAVTFRLEAVTSTEEIMPPEKD